MNTEEERTTVADEPSVDDAVAPQGELQNEQPRGDTAAPTFGLPTELPSGVKDLPPKPSLRRAAIAAFVALAMILASSIFCLAAANDPRWVSGEYKQFSRTAMHVVGVLWTLLPFSVVEIAIYLAVIGVPTLLVVTGVRSKKLGYALRRFAKVGSCLLLVAAILLSIFLVGWAPNYRSAGAAYEFGLEVRERSPRVLAAALAEIIGELNDVAGTLPRDDEGKVDWRDFREQSRIAMLSFAQASASYPQLAGCRPLLCKRVTLSRAMSYTGLTGVFMPLTGEASVNGDFPDPGRIFTMCHETAHSMGYAAENEANFIAALVCRESSFALARWSGLLAEFSYCYNALCGVDRELAYAFWYRLPQQAIDDFAERTAYWKQFEGEVQKVAQSVNDRYLKVMKQPSGVRSYGEVVDLLLADFVKRTGYTEG